ncbi:MAG: EF-hand domain-containing protein [Verrucomicrobiaceae bacterium]|nr:MAG: EF-hand domain-containing protein [Verrucomicrobiaceae bacterium]
MKFAPLFVLPLMAACSGPGPIVPETKVEKQMIGLLEKFDRYDLNGDGQLDSGELVAAQKSTGHPPSEIIGFYDRDNSRTISLREAQRGFSRMDEAEERADHTH